MAAPLPKHADELCRYLCRQMYGSYGMQGYAVGCGNAPGHGDTGGAGYGFAEYCWIEEFGEGFGDGRGKGAGNPKGDGNG